MLLKPPSLWYLIMAALVNQCTWELIRNANAWVHTKPIESEILEMESSNFILPRFPDGADTY